VCGAEETPSSRFDGEFCPRCLARENTKAVPRVTPIIRLCRTCGSLEEKGKWLVPSSKGLEEDLSGLIRRNACKFAGIKEEEVADISVIRIPVPLGSSSVLIPLSVKTQTKESHPTYPAKEFRINARLTPTICPNCLLIKSKYYEATLQVRTPNMKMPQTQKERLLSQIGNWVVESSGKDRQAFISKCEDKPEGFDLYLGSRRTAYSIAAKLKTLRGTSIRETFKAGKVDKSTGKRKGKVTILIRLPQETMNQPTNESWNVATHPKD
jgi:nonsense-mediated mRNA decay protein 3